MKKKNIQTHLNRGFTLVELLVVIAIIAALTFPALMSMRYKAGVTQTVSNMKQIGMANENYGLENHGQVMGSGTKSMPEFGITNEVHHVWRVAAYLGAHTSGGQCQITYADVKDMIYPLHHPHVPKYLSIHPTTTRWSVAVNHEFYAKDGNYPRTIKYDAANTIYCVSGFNHLRNTEVDDPAYAEIPESRRAGPYFTKKKQLPCLYLDGRVVLEKFPIDPAKVKPSLQD